MKLISMKSTKIDWRGLLERLVGVSFMFSGGVKLLSPITRPVFGVIEDTSGVFAAMAEANMGTEIGAISAWAAGNEAVLVPLVGLVMFVSGLAQVLRHSWSGFGAVVQSVLILCFVVFLHRAFPSVFFDGLYLIAFGLVYFEVRVGDLTTN